MLRREGGFPAAPAEIRDSRRRTSPQRRQTAWIGAEAPRLGGRRVRTVGKVRTAGEVRDPRVETSGRRRRSQRRAQRSGRVRLVEDRAVFAEPVVGPAGAEERKC